MVSHEEALKELANKNTVSEEEEKLIQYWCIQLGLTKAIITCGLVYPEGRGLAVSCNEFAKQLLIRLEGLGVQ